MSKQAVLTTPVDAVLRRVACELGTAASDLADLEVRVAALIGSGAGDIADLEQLQVLDRIGQQMRVLELFLFTASARASGEMDLAHALPNVWLEAVRTRLAGLEAANAAPAPAQEADLW